MNRKIAGKGKAFLIHFSGAAIIATACCALINTWYPAPYFEILHGKELLILITAIELTLGPTITFVLFNPAGSKKELLATTTIAILIQLSALSYGLYQAASSRPLFLAFEGDKFRIVSRSDIKRSDLLKAPKEMQLLSWSGVKVIAVKLLDAGDPGLLESVQQDLQGMHPAYRPQRWQNYETAKTRALEKSLNINPENLQSIAITPLQKQKDKDKDKDKDKSENIRIIPIVAYENKINWAAIIDPSSANITGFLKLK